MPTGRSTLVTDAKYIGFDVHQATVSAAVLDSTGNLVMEPILETKATTILQFFQGLRGSVHVALQEGIERDFLKLAFRAGAASRHPCRLNRSMQHHLI
jgi:hypothetical protein